MEPEGSMTYELLREITDNFSMERKVGEGSFGRVYRGEMKDGEEIAVKLLDCRDPGLDDERFNNEFCNLIRLKHPNTVKFLGYCYDTTIEYGEYGGRIVAADRIHRALCFEYLPNGSLDSYLRDESSLADWNTRYGIIRGICEGLKYLHQGERPTYHLDLKPGNILLDNNMVPKLADFGLSRIFHENFTRITCNLYGTRGYIPPEHIDEGLITEKFDIFSLGVVMLEIVSGPQGRTMSADMPRQEFIGHVQEEWRKRLETTFSGSLLEAYGQQIKMCTEIALTSIDYDPDRRRKINEIIDQLIESETSISNLEMDPRGKRRWQPRAHSGSGCGKGGGGRTCRSRAILVNHRRRLQAALRARLRNQASPSSRHAPVPAAAASSASAQVDGTKTPALAGKAKVQRQLLVGTKTPALAGKAKVLRRLVPGTRTPALAGRVEALRRRVPGGRKLPYPDLLEKAVDYIKELDMQVRALRALADSLPAVSSV